MKSYAVTIIRPNKFQSITPNLDFNTAAAITVRHDSKHPGDVVIITNLYTGEVEYTNRFTVPTRPIGDGPQCTPPQSAA